MKCTTWKKCVKSTIKTFKKQNHKKKINLKKLLKLAKVQYDKQKGSSSSGMSKTKKRPSSSKKRTTRKQKK